MAQRTILVSRTVATPASPILGSSPTLSLEEILRKKGIRPFSEAKVEVPKRKKSIVNPFTATKNVGILSRFDLYLDFRKFTTSPVVQPNISDPPLSNPLVNLTIVPFFS